MKDASRLSCLLYSLAVTTGKRAFRRRALRRPHPARREGVPCGDTDMDWPRPGAVLHTTGPWGRSYLGVGRRAASRAWQRALSKGRHGFTVRETLPWKNTRMGLPEGIKAVRTPSRVQGLTGDPGELAQVLGLASDCSAQSDCRGCWRNSTRVRRPGNWTGGENRRSYPRGEGEWRSKRDTSQFFPPLTCYPAHGKKLAQRRDCRISRRCSVSPSPQLYRCLPERRRAPTHRRRQHSVWSEPSPPWGTARLGIGTPRRWHPLCSGPTSAWRQPPFLLTTVTDKELLRASEAPGAVHVYAQCSYGTQQRQGWVCLLRRQCLQVHHLIAKGRGGNLGHVSRPGSQDNVRVVRPKHKALFAHRKCLEVPDPLMEVSAVRSAVLADRYPLLTCSLSSTESSGSQGPLWSPARTIERSQEGLRVSLGGFNLLAPLRNLTMRSCFPRDRPSTASWWAAIAAINTFKVEGDSLRSNLSCRKESTTPIVHLRGSSRREEHRFANRLHFST